MIMTRICEICHTNFSKKQGESRAYWLQKKYCSSKCYGVAKTGTKMSLESRMKLSKSITGHRPYFQHKGSDSPQWKGGLQLMVCKYCSRDFLVKPYRLMEAKFCSWSCFNKYRDEGRTTSNERARKSSEYKSWRQSVFERDNYTCQNCDKRGGLLNADHIKPFALFPELRTELSNGRTLCVECHKNTATFGTRLMWSIRKNLAQLGNF